MQTHDRSFSKPRAVMNAKPRVHPYALLGGIARAGLSVSIAYSYSVRLYLPKNAATLEASGSLSPSLEAISIMLTRTGDTAARGALVGMSVFSPDEALNVALVTALARLMNNRLTKGPASDYAERAFKNATMEACLAWESELDKDVTLRALADVAGISKSAENTKDTLLTLQSLREELSGQAQEKRVLIRPEIQYSCSGWDTSLSVTLDPWEHRKPSLCFLEPYWHRQSVAAFFQTPGSKAAQIYFSGVLHSLSSDMTPIDSLRECLEMPFPIIKVMPESDTAKGSGLSASAPAYSINALRPILQSLTGDPALHKAHPGYAASFIRREATNLAFALSDITPFSAIATSIPVLLIVLCRLIRSRIDAAGPDMVSVTDILSIVERILKRLEETAEVGKDSGRLMPFMAESNAAVIVATKQFLDTLYAFDGRSLAIPPIIDQIATEIKATYIRTLEAHLPTPGAGTDETPDEQLEVTYGEKATFSAFMSCLAASSHSALHNMRGFLFFRNHRHARKIITEPVLNNLYRARFDFSCLYACLDAYRQVIDLIPPTVGPEATRREWLDDKADNDAANLASLSVALPRLISELGLIFDLALDSPVSRNARNDQSCLEYHSGSKAINGHLLKVTKAIAEHFSDANVQALSIVSIDAMKDTIRHGSARLLEYKAASKNQSRSNLPAE